MLLVSVGIPVGGVCALISNSKKASHRIYILFSGLLGCIGLACVAAFEHSSLLLVAMLITHMSGSPESPGSLMLTHVVLNRQCSHSIIIVGISWEFNSKQREKTKQEKSKIKQIKKNAKKSKHIQMVKSMSFHLFCFLSFLFSYFSLLICFCFWDFADLLLPFVCSFLVSSKFVDS